jgi:uncharacterized protein (UPF0333 family)
MIKDNRGQISLEYMLIFAISLILLMVFTLPMAELTVKNTMDVSDALEVKSDLLELSHAIKQVYSQGQGSKQTVYIDAPSDIKISVSDSSVSCSLKLKDKTKKLIKVSQDSNLEKTSISIDRGHNTLVVEWPENHENMQIYEK